MMYLIAGLNGNTTSCSSINSRGLEDNTTQNKGYLKNHVTIRCKQAINAVLRHQQVQQNRLQQIIMHQQQQQYQKPEEPQIRKVYENYTTFNVLNAITMGRCDSTEALSVYVDDQQQHK